jgi:hypothetical protein
MEKIEKKYRSLLGKALALTEGKATPPSDSALRGSRNCYGFVNSLNSPAILKGEDSRRREATDSLQTWKGHDSCSDSGLCMLRKPNKLWGPENSTEF